MRKPLKILTVTLAVIILLLTILYSAIFIYFKAGYNAFLSNAVKEFEIPLDDNFVPQGFHHDEVNGFYVVSGYNSKDEVSPIYILKAEDGSFVKKINLKKKNGNDFKGHAGGVAVNGDYLYIAGGNGAYVFNYGEILSASTGDSVKYLGHFSTEVSDSDQVNSSFISAYNGKLVIGEFYSDPKYPTLDSHKITSSTGEKFGAFAVEFNFDSASTYGINPVPQKLYSITNKVQGMTFSGDSVYLSTSLGFNPSYVYKHDLTALTSEGTFTILGTTVPHYSLGSASLEKTYKCYPMAEELVIKNGRIFVMSEFACNKYILGKFVDGKWCYSIEI